MGNMADTEVAAASAFISAIVTDGTDVAASADGSKRSAITSTDAPALAPSLCANLTCSSMEAWLRKPRLQRAQNTRRLERCTVAMCFLRLQRL